MRYKKYLLPIVIIIGSFLPFVSKTFFDFESAKLGINLGYYGFLIPVIEFLILITIILEKRLLLKILSLIEFLFILLLFIVSLYILVLNGSLVLSIGSYVLLIGSFIQFILALKNNHEN